MEENKQEALLPEAPEVSKQKISKNYIYILFFGVFVLILAGIFTIFFSSKNLSENVIKEAFIKEIFPEGKIVYDNETPESVVQNHCTETGGIYNSCGSSCSKDAEACITVCARTCEVSPSNNNSGGNQVACTQEAKLCPDGSYVGRTGPNCEFEKCPGDSE
jgi:hypothetical protein